MTTHPPAGPSTPAPPPGPKFVEPVRLLASAVWLTGVLISETVRDIRAARRFRNEHQGRRA